MTQEATAAPKSAQSRRETPSSQDPGAFLAARSRYVEDELAAAKLRGATQYVALGAALDNFTHSQADSRLRVIEAEQPLGSRLGPQLRSLGFSDAEITFFSWMGATPNPTVEAAIATFAFIGSLPRGSSVAFDYAMERSSLDAAWPMAMDPLASRFGGAGEPCHLYLDPNALHSMLNAAGFHHIEDRHGTTGFAHLVTARV